MCSVVVRIWVLTCLVRSFGVMSFTCVSLVVMLVFGVLCRTLVVSVVRCLCGAVARDPSVARMLISCRLIVLNLSLNGYAGKRLWCLNGVSVLVRVLGAPCC